MKINTRPVYFLHKLTFCQHYFPLSRNEYASVADLLAEGEQDLPPPDHFSLLIGHDESLKKPIEQMKTALFYPDGGLPLFLVKGKGKCRELDDRVERFAQKIIDHLVVIDPREYPLDGIDDAFRWLLAPCVVSTLLVDRLAAHFEHQTGHDLNIRRYYRQFDD